MTRLVGGEARPALIDVLIPVYNARATLEASVRSILDQTERDLRVVLVDDGSTDGSGEMMDAFAAADGRVTVLHQPNGGIVDALNAGLRLCTAEFIARHDADDLAAPDRFARQLAYLRAHPDCVALAGAARHIDGRGRVTGLAPPAQVSRADARRAPSREPYLMHPFLMVRREALQRVGGYRHVFHAEDTDLYWRLLSVGRLHNLNDVLGDYRVHEGSVSSRSVVNGRVAAIHAQLAGVSHLRRESGAADLPFPRDGLSRWTAAATLPAMMELIAPELTEPERTYLRVAVAAKMMELTRFRSYELELSDIIFIRRAVRDDLGVLSPENQRDLATLVRSTSARLLRKGRLDLARPLLTARALPGVAVRALAQGLLRLLPPGVQRRARALRYQAWRALTFRDVRRSLAS